MFIKLTSLTSNKSTWVNPRHIICMGSLVGSAYDHEDSDGSKGTVYGLVDYEAPKLCEETPEEILELIRLAGIPAKAPVSPLHLAEEPAKRSPTSRDSGDATKSTKSTKSTKATKGAK